MQTHYSKVNCNDASKSSLTPFIPRSKDHGLSLIHIYLIDKQKTEDEKKGKKVSSPYKIGNVILWADNYTSKAYGSVVETTRGYRFSKFSGYAQFPNSSGKYYYRLKDGIRTPLAYRADENVYRIEPYDTIEVYDKKLPRIIDLRCV